MNADIRRAVLRSSFKDTCVVADVDGSPLVFPNPSHCVRFLNTLRTNLKRVKQSEEVIYTMVALDDPTYKKLIKEKKTCPSH